MTHMAVADDPRPNSWHFVSDCTSVLSYLYLTMPPNGCSTGCYVLHAANINIYFLIKSLRSVTSVSIEHFKLNHKQKLPWRIWSTSSLTYHLDQTNLSIAVCSSLNHRKDPACLIAPVLWYEGPKRNNCAVKQKALLHFLTCFNKAKYNQHLAFKVFFFFFTNSTADMLHTENPQDKHDLFVFITYSL